MRQTVTAVGIFLVLMGAFLSNVAAEVNAPITPEQDSASAVSVSPAGFDLVLLTTSSAGEENVTHRQGESSREFEPALLKEHAYPEESAFAGLELDLPTSPLSIVLAADDQMNPAYGLKLHLVW